MQFRQLKHGVLVHRAEANSLEEVAVSAGALEFGLGHALGKYRGGDRLSAIFERLRSNVDIVSLVCERKQLVD